MDNTKEEILKMLKNRRGKYLVIPWSISVDDTESSMLYCTKQHPSKCTRTAQFKKLCMVKLKYPLYETFILLHTQISETELPFILLNDNSNTEFASDEIESYI